MKFTIAIVALATAVVASPAPLEARTGAHSSPGSGGNTNSQCASTGNTQQNTLSCCNSQAGLISVLDGVLCSVAVLGSSCSVDQSQYCCEAPSSGGLINIGLDCVKL